MENEIITKRIDWIDTAKLIGIFFMIIGHVMEEMNMSTLLYYYIYSFHMPLFFILSGITFSNKNSLKKSIYKYFFQLVIPYIFFYCIDYVFWFFVSFLRHPEVFERSVYVGLIKPFVGIFVGYDSFYSINVGKSIWFFIVLFSCKTISRLFDEISSNYRFLELFFSLFTVIMSYYLFYNKINLPFYIPETMMSYFFFYIGKLVKNKIHFRKKYFYILLFLITFIIQLVGCYFQKGVGIRGINMGTNYFGLLFYPLAIIGCLSIVMLCNIIPPLKGNLKYLSMNTVIIVGYNRFLITIIRKSLGFIIRYKTSFLFDYFYIIIISLFVLLFSFFPCYIMQKYFPFFIGKGRMSYIEKQ